MEQNELAINFYNMGLFNPQMSDQALACLDIMDFDHKIRLLKKYKQMELCLNNYNRCRYKWHK